MSLNSSEMSRRAKGSRLVVFAVALAGLVGLGAVCDFLFGEDTRPPDCRIVQPSDSASVSGSVTLRAEAYDSSGVAMVEFYVDGNLTGRDSTSPYTATWDASGQPDQSWHTVFCTARDPYDNSAASDTVAVQVWKGGQRDVLHAAFELNNNYYWLAGFTAAQGDTLAGDLRVLNGRTLSRFIWLDATNYREFSNGRAYSAVLEQLNQSVVSIREPVAVADSFYLVFLNASGSTIEVWARFTLE